MVNSVVHTFKYGNNTVSLETGNMAKQATSSVMVNIDDTVVLVTVVSQVVEQQTKYNFFPLVVHYQERAYARGRIPGGFFRRESRSNDNEILISRLIDRSIRILFPEEYVNNVQIIITVMSLNPKVNPDIVSLIGTSAALSLSGIPFNGPVGVARVGIINDEYILNPSNDIICHSILDLVVVSTNKSVIMVEASANCVSEEVVLNAINFGYEQQQVIIENIKKFSKNAGIDINNSIFMKKELQPCVLEVVSDISELYLRKAYDILSKKDRYLYIDQIKKDTVNKILDNNIVNCNQDDIHFALNIIERKIVRDTILYKKIRIDGRKNTEIRPIDTKISILPRTHGSALFTRGETQALVTVTLGTDRDAQNVDELMGDRIERFLFHYNFLPYCVGEIGTLGGPKRREIGHGYLAKKALIPVMPNLSEFSYTIRIVSEILESNGSSSMASVCGASLSLMDAGVPIKEAVAGIAMGLIKEGDDFVVLSDILSDEDHLGDIDFKITGTRKGITALQMDVKILDINEKIFKSILYQSKEARIKILDLMNNRIVCSRKDISKFAPRIYTMKINLDKIKDVIGKGGSVIRSLTEETGTVIEIKDDGVINISATDSKKAGNAIRRIQELTAEIIIGSTYTGTVIRIVEFGAFIKLCGNKSGLVHISQISNRRVENISDYLKLGQNVLVKVLNMDRQGRIKLSIKETNFIF